TFTVKDLCLNTTTKTQTIQINDTTAPSLTAPANAVLEGCDTGAIAGLAYSQTPVTIGRAPCSGAGGNASDACGLSSTSYQDSRDGTCLIITARTFTAKDLCLNTTTKTQTIQIDDTTAPSLTAPANAVLEGCDTGAIAALAYSQTPV